MIHTDPPAKSLQLCPTLCDPIDGSPPGSAVPGILDPSLDEFSETWRVIGLPTWLSGKIIHLPRQELQETLV